MYAFLPSPKGVNYNCTAHLPILKVLYGVYIYYAEQRADPDRRERKEGGGRTGGSLVCATCVQRYSYIHAHLAGV